jgi:UDP-N-acetylmuramate dehydrogenase
MEKNKKERQEKGHYLFPCAGSAFKNNRDFGKPTGLIIDELGLKGFSIGGAQIAPFHGNFVINTGNATAKDIRLLVDEVAAKVKTATGFILEPEILFVGEW